MKNKQILFTKKINDNGLLKKEVNAFYVTVICGRCSKSDNLLAEISNPKECGWIFMSKFNDNKIKPNGCWFCSEKCQKKQIKDWRKK